MSVQPTRSGRRRIPAAFTSVALAATVAGCGGGSEEPAASDDKATITIEHAMGSTVIEGQPKRVAALDASYVDAAIALETEVVAFTSYRTIDGELPEYLGSGIQEYAADAQDIGSLEEPSLEKLAEINPDLIVSAKVRHEALYDELSELAPTIFSDSTGPTWKENILLLGQALGKEDLAEEKIKAYEDRAAAIGDEIKTTLGALPTISIVRFAGEPTVRLYTENSFPGEVMNDVGFPRPEGQPPSDTIAADISQEQIPVLDADYMFVSVWDPADTATADIANQFKTNPLWATLTGEIKEVQDITWFTAVGLQGAHSMLDDLAEFFDVDPHTVS